MTDRELLEAAAKAAGYADAQFRDIEGWGDVRYGRKETMWSQTLFEEDGSGYWNPLVDDGEALRLAVKLRLNITFTAELGRGFKNEFMQVSPRSLGHLAEFGPLGSDPGETLRRAIVRAAAAMAG